jgi:CRP/FNR family transcriptional regulator, cyclic AMP receptor protein
MVASVAGRQRARSRYVAITTHRSPLVPSRPHTVNVVLEDRDLAEAIAPDRREAAVRLGVAPLLRVPAGDWSAADAADAARGGYGLLVLSGWLVRRVGIGPRIGAELLGPGDLLRPQEHDGEEATLPFEARWRVLEPLRLAVLDRAWSRRMAMVPEAGIEIAGRAMRRSWRAANALAIAQHARLDEALHLLLWELADRYGTVHADGIHLGVPLTHELLANLAAARRPSVSAALARLTDAGIVERRGRGFILHGDPPAPPTPDGA